MLLLIRELLQFDCVGRSCRRQLDEKSTLVVRALSRLMQCFHAVFLFLPCLPACLVSSWWSWPWSWTSDAIGWILSGLSKLESFTVVFPLEALLRAPARCVVTPL